MGESLKPGFFEEMYAKAADPFDFETSEYEAAKYQHTMAMIPRERYQQGLEIGCSIGVLTRQLGEKCERLLSLDVAERALARARARCVDLPGITFARMVTPQEFPEQKFDLVVVSEVAYYWSVEDLGKAMDRIAEHQTAGGHLVLVHWRPPVDYHVHLGDAVHEAWLEDPRWRRVNGAMGEQYRIDVLERVG